MFSLHERIQRKVCRTTFVLLCAVPTLNTLCWVAYFHRPWQEMDWQHELESMLHVRATVAKIAASRPLERELSSLRIASLPSGAPMLDVDRLKLVTGETLLANEARILTSQLKEIAAAIEIWLAGDSFIRTKWQIGSLLLAGEGRQLVRFNNVQVVSEESVPSDRKITIQGKTKDGQQVRLLVERTSEGKLKCTFDAQRSVLPAWLLAGVMPGANRWEEASFSGLLSLESSHIQTAGKFRGTVRDIDTRKWTGSDLLRATVSLSLESLCWRDGRIETVKGTIQSASGEIERSLVKTFEEKLLCQVAAEVQSEEGAYSFDQLACRFEISKEGLKIVGTCPIAEQEATNCLMASEGRMLVMQPAYILPLGRLIQVFCPLDQSWLPATREATNMASNLPLPDSATLKK